MSSLLLKRSLSVAPIAHPRVFLGIGTSRAAIHQSPRQHSLRESDTNREEDLREEISQRTLEHHKDRQRGEPKWHESLASDSEASIRADKEGFPSSEGVSGSSKDPGSGGKVDA